MKATKFTRRKVSRRFALSVTGLCLILQIGCASFDPGRSGLPYDDIPCSATEARRQMRLYLVEQGFRIKDDAEGREHSIVTLAVMDQRRGQRERRVEYVVEIRPTETANKSNAVLRWIIESRGVRERTWYGDDENTGPEPEHVKAISQRIRTLCRPAQ